GAPPPPVAVPGRAVSPAAADSQHLFERLGKMEQRLDWLTQQNDALRRENKVLTEKLAAPFPNINGPGPPGVTSGPRSGTGSTAPAASGAAGDGARGSSAEAVGPPGTSGEPDRPGDGSRGGSGRTAGGGSDRAAVQTGGGRSLSRAAGGDPTAVG